MADKPVRGFVVEVPVTYIRRYRLNSTSHAKALSAAKWQEELRDKHNGNPPYPLYNQNPHGFVSVTGDIEKVMDWSDAEVHLESAYKKDH